MDTEKNFEFFVNTIKSLAPSQGFYGRILSQINEMNETEIEELKSILPPFENGSLSVIFYLEDTQ